MAIYIKEGKGNFEKTIDKLHNEIIGGSFSASLEHKNKVFINDVLVETRVYERYSMIGSNRLSLSLTLIGNNDNLNLTLITAGGSQAIFFKINRFGENRFLNKIKPIADSLIK